MKYSFLIVLIVSFSCSTNKSETKEIRMTTPEARLVTNSFNDSTFFSKISGIISSEATNNLFFIDKNLGTIFQTDLTLNLKRKIGQSGSGPNEINSPSLGYSQKDNLYIFDPGNGRMIGFSIKNIDRDSSVQDYRFKHYDIGKFFVKDSIVYFSDRNSQNTSITKFNLENLSSEQEFGLLAKKEFQTPQRHLVELKSGMFSIYAENAPIIEYYDFSGKLVDSFDFSDYSIFKERLSVDNSQSIIIKGATKPLPIYKNIIWDVKLVDDKLYLLVLSKKDETSTQSNTVLVLDWIDEKLTLSQQINLPKKGWYSRFTILESSKDIVAFDEVNGTIEIFGSKD